MQGISSIAEKQVASPGLRSRCY